jgi:two-component system, LytTR family, sensor kinase
MKKEIFIHIIIWLIYAGYNLTDNYLNARAYFYPGELFLTYSILAGIFYIHAFFIFPFYYRKNNFLFWLFVIIAWALFLAGNYLIEGVYAVKFYGATPIKNPGFTNYVIPVSWYFFQFVLYALGYYYAKKAIQRQKEIRILEKEKYEREISFLNAQNSPHFMFNTLNQLYDKAYEASPELAEDIMNLSDVMRYSIRKPDADGLVPLEEEVEYIEKMIHISKSRFNNNLHIIFEKEGSSQGIRIVPHILMTIVENIFKHGDLKNANFPVYIALKVNESAILFSTTNKKRQGPKVLGYSLGEEFIRKSLAITYQDKYSFSVDDKEDAYYTKLEIAI